MSETYYYKLQNALAKTITFHICFMTCKNMIVTSTFLYKYNSVLNIMAIVLLTALYINVMFINKGIHHIPRKTFFISCGVFLFWFISYSFDNRLFVDNIWPYNYVRKAALFYIAYGFPLFVSTSMLDDYDKLKRLLYKAVDMVYCIGIISFVLSRTSLGISTVLSDSYSMSYGNNLLVCSAILCIRFLDQRNYIDIIKMISLAMFIFVDGSRGPLISIFVMFMYMGWRIRSSKKGVIIIGLFAGLIAFVLLFKEAILIKLISIFNDLGIQSRSLVLLRMGEFVSHDSGRSVFHKNLIEAINKSPIWGLGAFAGEKTVSMSHSFYLDVFANFGYVFGAIFLIVIVINIIRTIRFKPNSMHAYMILMYSFILFPRGFFDDNLWGVESIWIIIGVIISSRRLMKRKGKNDTRNV